ncbi:PVC-type heme-binding CxxCH protein [Rhodopirellula sp. P2]|uniref:PVC-type heme-binding CxxCH protein n=1 Tax=Rhodopirellula sp. P2 TaxID=2127060 RepID=UPI002367DDEC|nr:PVC-type heme-binding CxxCH protein [Rhodopirellula sp. P2]WDQ19417.1 GDSL-type esterase/lipase family protein [Rhodopirellula sp. P2]
MLRRILTVFLLCGGILPSLMPQAGAEEAFEFQANDVVAIYGNGLADRMQHDPWVETFLQYQLKGLDVSFRNMSFSGDKVNQRPRNKGFTNDIEYLKHVAPDVVFSFYGFNESFAGPEKAAAYRDELIQLVQRYTQARKDEGEDLRFVLFSPIAYENTGDPNLPDGTELNANLAAYTEATREAAEETGAKFVDLFSPTFQLFQSSSKQLTLNGVHLNASGYEELAGIISRALLDSEPAADADLGPVYDAVKDKNWHWHNRYRATDGNDIWGSRSTLTFVDGQSNADVLKHELVMLDVMTANRDKVIWAAAQGRTLQADDSNVPPPVKVTSNIGGGSASSNAMKEGSVAYLSPEESREKINVPDGYELNVFASEVQFPDLANPVQMQVDAKGRLWVASWNTYPKWEPGKEMNDSLMILEDTDKDGKADVRKIFAHVHNPLGFEFWNGGVVVTSGPDLLFLKDTDGDDKADVRYPILQGLGTSDTHHAANNLIYGPDGGIYWQSGIFLVHNHETPWKQNLNIGASGMYRFDPLTFAITPHAGNSPNPHGTSFDSWGYCYASDGTGGRCYQVRPEGNGFKMHQLLEKEFRPVAANAILSSEHFPEELQDDILICNTIGFLGVKQYKLDREGDVVEEDSLETTQEESGPVKITPGGGLITVNHPALKDAKITGFKLSVNGRQQMNLSEVEVISGGRNIADTAKLAQSSEYSNGAFPVQRLVDGDKGNFAHTSQQKDPWMRGDFPAPVQISEFKVWNRKGFEDRFNNGKIEFFNGKDVVAAVDIEIAAGAQEEKRREVGEVWGTPGLELLNSDDRNFRPTDAVVGEDGALYVSDWHNAIIGHMQHNIRDPNRDHAHGRIFRLTVKDRPLQKPVKIAGQPIEALLENLKHPVNGVRHRTRIELTQHDSDQVIAATQKWMADFDPNDETEAHHLLEALWLHQRNGVKNQALLNQLLESDVRHAVVAAKTVRHFWEKVDTTGGSEFAAPAELEFVKYDPPKHLSPADQKTYELGATIYQRESHCATCHMTHGKGTPNVYPPLVGSPWVNGSEDRLIKMALHGVWGKMTVAGKTYDPARGVPPMTAFRSLLKDDEMAAVLTFVRNTWGNEASVVSPQSVSRVREETKDRTTFYQPEEILRLHPLEKELMDENAAPEAEVFSNEALEQELLAASPSKLARVALAKGNFQRGKRLFHESSAACFACHLPPAGTVRMGPDLEKATTKRTNEELVDALLRPSKLIDKDFAQLSVLTVDGQIFTGIRVSENDDEIVLRNLAQPEPITIPQDDVEEVIESEVSLMPENLMRQMKSRREFNDLLKYIIEVRKK